MRRRVKQILQILDGSPAVYGSRSRGQSVVELTLVTPILIILIMGLAEIGWFANNYLILLETTRVGARFGTVQVGDTSPLRWNNNASLSPNYFPNLPGEATSFRNCQDIRNDATLQGFYNLLTCVMLQSMAPLQLHGPGNAPNGEDDIVISAFSFQGVNPVNPDLPQAMRNSLAAALVPGIPANQPQVLVTGRYPTNANECTVDQNGAFRVWERDPFDYIQNGTRDWVYINSALMPDPNIEENRLYFELAGYDTSVSGNQATWERQRGWSYTGQHRITGTGAWCIGSEWTIADIQRLMNLPGFSLLAQQRPRLPEYQGMVLVEMFWRHELLLRNPVFNPVFTILGPNTVVSVWAAFPLPSAEQRIRYRVD